MNSITINFDKNRMAVLHSTMLTQTNRMGIISGSKGYVEVQNINNCEAIRVYDQSYQLQKTYEIPEQITGFEYQVQACIEAIESKKTECEQMSHREILRVMQIMDEVREQWGMKFPCEEV